MLLTIPFALIVFIVSIAGVRYFIGWSLGREILDVPNERSSHATPVPVGAGIVIAGSVLTAFVAGHFAGGAAAGSGVSQAVLFSYVAGAVLIVGVSWLDDVKGVDVGIRFLVHSVAALILLYAAVSWRSAFPGFPAIGIIVSFFWIVGLTNAYNFMDGIDGIAGSQAVVAGLAWAGAGYVLGAGTPALIGLAVAASCGAYLFFNWQPAKVFMGDAGSAFLGFTLASIPILAFETVAREASAGSPARRKLFILTALWGVAFVWPFVFDSSFTLVRRIVNLEKVWNPHRSHLYQQMVEGGRSHATVALVYGVAALICSSFALWVRDSIFVSLLLCLCALALLMTSKGLESHSERL